MELNDHRREPTPLEVEHGSKLFWQTLAQSLLLRWAEARSRGGRSAKYARGIQDYLDSLDDRAIAAPAKELFLGMPQDGEEPAIKFGDYYIYRDGKKIFQVHDPTGKDRAIGFRAFEKYVKRSRDERK